MGTKSRRRIEFGDFQTPMDISRQICDLLFAQGLRPASILEPTCGEGNLLLAALDRFASAAKAIGMDINPQYVGQVRDRLKTRSYFNRVTIFQGDFFDTDWEGILADLPDPILVIGNPPWVTSSELASLNSKNIPPKSNFQGISGLDAKTGKSNFDISEWMIIRLLESMDRRDATIAMLCKTGVARKVLVHAWKQGLNMGQGHMYCIDASNVFGTSVDACLLVCSTMIAGNSEQACRVYTGISESEYQTTFGYRDGFLIADMKCYERWKHLKGQDPYRWRSGIKHDCAKVMELEQVNHAFRNGLGELWDLEPTYVYPMLKGSDLAKGDAPRPSRWMLIPQRTIGEDTRPIKYIASRTWAYLSSHREFFAKRKSSVYKGRPDFSIFGVGEYSFAPWKIAVSGLYKKLHFTLIGPYAGRPVVLDDTCYFLPCRTKEEAQFLKELLNSKIASEFFQAYIFWDAKRPVTIDILERLNLVALARELGAEDTLASFRSDQGPSARTCEQLPLFDKNGL